MAAIAVCPAAGSTNGGSSSNSVGPRMTDDIPLDQHNQHSPKSGAVVAGSPTGNISLKLSISRVAVGVVPG